MSVLVLWQALLDTPIQMSTHPKDKPENTPNNENYIFLLNYKTKL